MDLSFIIEDVVKEGIAKAKEAYRLLVDLHEHLMVKKVQIANTEIEDEEYLAKADNDWYQVVRLKAAYESHSKEKKPEVLAGGSSSVSAGSSPGLKLKKIEVRQFSGQRREYAASKRDFKEIVLTGRPDAEIGAILKSSIPYKYLYLFDNLSLSEHSKMMEVLDAKFGKPKLIVDETVAEMERIKPIQNDQEFISFVQKIDKIRRDLSELGMEGEVQNQTVLSQLEKKLPYMVKRDWIKKVNEEFEDSTPKQIFEEFIKFLKLTKKEVEYDNSENRSGTSHGKGKSFKSFTMGEAEERPKQGGGRNNEPKRQQELAPCLACNDGKTNLESCLHKMSDCSVFKAMPLKDLLSRVKCKKCPFSKDN